MWLLLFIALHKERGLFLVVDGLESVLDDEERWYEEESVEEEEEGVDRTGKTQRIVFVECR